MKQQNDHFDHSNLELKGLITENVNVTHTNFIVSSISTWKSLIFCLILQFKGVYEKEIPIPVEKQLKFINIGKNVCTSVSLKCQICKYSIEELGTLVNMQPDQMFNSCNFCKNPPLVNLMCNCYLHQLTAFVLQQVECRSP